MKSFTLLFLILFTAIVSWSQRINIRQFEIDLLSEYNRLFSFYESNQRDSVEKYSDELKEMMLFSLSKSPATLKYPFRMLIDSNAFDIVTSEDSLFRIYSWNTWTGGSMRFYNIIYQYGYNGKVITEFLELDEGDAGGFFSEIFTLKTGNKTFYLAISNGQSSSKYHWQMIEIFAIEKGKLNKDVHLIKTAEGMTSHINFEYDFFSVVDRPERPLKLIKYDKTKKIIYIPVVHEDGTVTSKFIQYKFNGKYFGKYKIQ